MLKDILASSSAVNALKRLTLAKSALPVSEFVDSAVSILTAHALVFSDGETVSVSLKGKQFIALVDDMKDLIESSSPKTVRMSFSLTLLEQDILLLITREGDELSFNELLALGKEKNVIENRDELLKVIKGLVDIQLLQVKKNMVHITRLGKRTITETLLESFNLR